MRGQRLRACVVPVHANQHAGVGTAQFCQPLMGKYILVNFIPMASDISSNIVHHRRVHQPHQVAVHSVWVVLLLSSLDVRSLSSFFSFVLIACSVRKKQAQLGFSISADPTTV